MNLPVEPDTCELLCLDVPKAEAARERMPAIADLNRWAAGAKALADPTRLAVALALAEAGRACVCDLGWIVGRDEKLVSHHVRALRAAGLAGSEREGKMVMYTLTEAGRALLAAVTPNPGVSARVELPLAGVVASAPPTAAISTDRYRELAARVRLLSWLSLAVMSVEGVVAMVAGIMAGSIALVGFGLDSAIEGFASVVIIWRFTGARVLSQSAEQRAQKLVALQFFVLAPYVGVESMRALLAGEHPDVSALGMALAVFSLITMPLLGIAKQRLAEQIGSPATKGEGRQNVLCAYLAGALLVGLAGNAIAGAWWLDPVVGLLIAAVAVEEGAEAWRGDGCCVSSPLDGYAAEAENCDEDCCS